MIILLTQPQNLEFCSVQLCLLLDPFGQNLYGMYGGPGIQGLQVLCFMADFRGLFDSEILACKSSISSDLCAVYGIIGFVDVPIVYLSIYWWRTIHPRVISPDKVDLDPQNVVRRLDLLYDNFNPVHDSDPFPDPSGAYEGTCTFLAR